MKPSGSAPVISPPSCLTICSTGSRRSCSPPSLLPTGSWKLRWRSCAVADDGNIWDRPLEPRTVRRKPRLQVVERPDGVSEEASWYSRLQKNRDGAVLPTVGNAMMILSYEPPLRELLTF